LTPAEFFHHVVKKNYEAHCSQPNDFHHLWNAVVSMNTVAEYLALERVDYAEISREDLAQRANKIRDKTLHLGDLKYCAETLKHVRKIVDHRDIIFLAGQFYRYRSGR